MSRQIDWSKPLSAEDHEWALQYPVLHAQIEANRAEFPVSDEDADVDESDVADYDDGNKWKVRDLQMEIERRNKEFGTDMKTDGRRQDLVDRLREDDAQAEAAAQANG